MAAINDLIDRISDPELRRRISDEVARMQQQKKFGLVFEEHLPEATPLYDVPIKRKSLVAEKDGFFKVFYRVKRIEGEKLVCETQDDKHEEVCFEKEKMVAVAMFGDPIYPYLKPIDEVQNAPDDKLWHTLIEAENYHALQLLIYLYGGKVDCIYIDPPYNTGDKSWKYNNDYVDSNDSYRHSKWLSMMKKRLLLAKKLLNPKDSVLIVTIDEKEYLRLGCLIEELFPEARIQMVSSVISPQGATREKQFSRTDEYLFFIEFGNSAPQPLILGQEWSAGVAPMAGSKSIVWDSLKRRGSNSLRRDRPNLFYPIYVSEDGLRIMSIGESLSIDEKRFSTDEQNGCKAIWPIRSNGDEGNWQLSQKQLLEKYKKGFVRMGKFDERGSMSISYLKRNEQKKVETGIFQIVGKREDGSIITDKAETEQKRVCGTQWRITSHNAGTYGTALLLKVLGEKRFNFPKSLYAVHDTIRFFVANNPNALIVDFFAGSGTTLHAVNLLNKEDGGHRQCIMVTNNEVSADEEKRLRALGHQPGDDEWERLGIARYVNWPRTVCSIEGHDINEQPLKGNYLGSDIPMSEGFAANAKYFKLGFLDKDSVELQRQFRELLPLLWMKAGAIGRCPELEGSNIPEILLLEDNSMAILTDEEVYVDFRKMMEGRKDIKSIFIVTNSEDAFMSMAKPFGWAQCYQLYKDYLENFSINYERR